MMVQSSSAPRQLMNQLRSLMAQGGHAPERLDRVVKLIAGNMVADVCSIYLLTPDSMLELVATEGLRPEAVSRTRLHVDEGLVGQIAISANPLSIQDAPRHPAFSYRPETGEDPYHAFLGVPILRNGRVTGVLTVQNRTARIYGEDEVEALQTVAMVLAEVLAGISDTRKANLENGETRPAFLLGRRLCGGIGIGIAKFHDPVVPAAKFFAMDPDSELQRLDAALNQLRLSVDAMVTIDSGALMDEPRDVLETYRLLAHDRIWAERLREAIAGGLTAEAAVDKARREHRARLETATDAYLRERLFDLEDLDNRLLRILGGTDPNGDVEPDDSSEPTVIVARRLGPADLLEYRGHNLAGILIEEASVSSHAAIVARALGIPTLGNIPRLTTQVEDGDKLIVDADSAKLHVRPDESLQSAFVDRISLRDERQATYRAMRDLPAVSQDGREVQLMVNAGLELDVEGVGETGADGIGLFRTEFQFLISEQIPSLGEQVELYSRVIDSVDNKPVTFRTLDLGGDKMLPNLNRAREENPALGWRSIRFALDTRGLFRRQLRALIRAARGRSLRIMFPMVTVPEEFFAARDCLMAEIDWSEARGYPRPNSLEVGAMLEAPSLAYALSDIAEEADFLSLGTNDLMQFFFAADRMTPAVSDRYDIISRPALRFLKQVTEDCRNHNLPVSICGEASGHPLQALCLASLGFETLSMPASQIGPVRKAIRSVHLGELGHKLCTYLESGRSNLRKDLLALFDDLGVDVDAV